MNLEGDTWPKGDHAKGDHVVWVLEQPPGQTMTLWGPAHPSLPAAIEEPLGNANSPCDDELTFSTTSSAGIG